MIREKYVLESLREQWIQDWQPDLQKNACILAGRLGKSVIDLCGLNVKVVPVGVVVYNQSGWDNQFTHSADLPDSAWNVACTGRIKNLDVAVTSTGGWDGHLLLETDNYFLDLTANAFSRPEHGINIPGPLLVHKDQITTLHERDSQFKCHEVFQAAEFSQIALGSGCTYNFSPELWNTDYRKSPNWTYKPTMNKDDGRILSVRSMVGLIDLK